MQQNTSPKVLVTGGAGFFGSHICERLLLDGNQVIIVDAFNDEISSRTEKKKHIEYLNQVSKSKKGTQLKVFELDLLEEDLLRKVLKDEKPTSCIHAAALVRDRKSIDEPIRYIVNNIQGTQSLINAIQKTSTSTS